MVWLKKVNNRVKYYDDTKAKPPSSFLYEALKYAKGKKAIDLGCGSGVETREIARKGFYVIAVDVNEEVKSYFTDEDLKNIKLVIQPIEDFQFVNCDFIYAKSSLVFLSPGKFFKVIEKIKNSLEPGGVFAARLWGKNDSDNKSRKNYKYTFLDIDDLNEIFKSYTFHYIYEHEEDKLCADGRMKHWDFIDAIVQKTN